MPKRKAIGISRRSVERLFVERGDALFWDHDLTSFGVRVFATGRKVYVAETRGPAGRSKRVPIGVHGAIAPDEARGKAAAVIDQIGRGEEPLPPEPAPPPTMAELAERHAKAHLEVNCRPSTVKTCRRVLDLHILPALGTCRWRRSSAPIVAELHFKMRDKPAQANQPVEVLSKMFRLAETWGMTPPRRSPCRRIRAYKRVRRERFLTPEEYRRLGCVPAVQHRRDPAAAADRLPQGRDPEAPVGSGRPGGRRVEPAGHQDGAAHGRAVAGGGVGAVPHLPAGGQPACDPGEDQGGPMRDLNDPWEIVCERARLADMRLHDCRHSYASRALALGESLPMIGRLLGHTQVETTARYAHLAQDSVKESADRVADSIAGDLLAKYAG